MQQRRTWPIVIAIVVGLLLACAVLPLGGMALVLALDGGRNPNEPQAAGRWQEQVISGSGSDRIVVLYVEGVIGADESGLFGGGTGHSALLSQIRQATEDPRVQAVVVRVDSPGGGVVASNEIYMALKKLRESGKNVVVSMGSVAASGGYYISMAAERIYANQDTFTGSLGVIISTLNYQEAFEQFGLRQMVYKSGEFKDIGSPARTATDEEQAILQGIVDQAYQGFVDVIVEGRRLPRETVLQVADGRIYTGKQARDLGLVDELGSLDDAIDSAQSLAGLERALVVRYQASDSFLELLRGSLIQSQRPADPLGVREVMQQRGPLLEYRMLP